jgi:hypothetical protein
MAAPVRARTPPQAVLQRQPASAGSAVAPDALSVLLARAVQQRAPALDSVPGVAPPAGEQIVQRRRRHAAAPAHPAATPEMMDGRQVAPWIVPSLQWARENGWSGTVVSGYRSCEDQKRAAAQYARRTGRTVEEIYPRGVCRSNHMGLEYPHGAVDVTDYEELNRVLQNSPITPALVWGGPVINDQVHFSANGH